MKTSDHPVHFHTYGTRMPYIPTHVPKTALDGVIGGEACLERTLAKLRKGIPNLKLNFIPEVSQMDINP